MPGFESNRFVDLPETVIRHFSCDICLNIFNNPIRSGCGHSFCKDCVKDSIESKHSNHNTCPKCRKPFKRKRTQSSTNDDNVVIVGSFIFNRNLDVNNFINDYKIKCNYELNGCQKVIELGLLSTHLRQCEHRFCKRCGIDINNDEQHNTSCVEFLNTQKIELEDKVSTLKAVVKTLEEEKTTTENKIRELEAKTSTFDEVVNKYKNEIKTNENTIKVLTNKISTLEENKIRELKEKVRTLEEMVNKCMEDSEKDYYTIEVLKIEKSDLVNYKIRYESKIKEFEEKVAPLEEVVNRLESERKTNVITIKVLREEISALKNKVSTFEKVVNRYEKEKTTNENKAREQTVKITSLEEVVNNCKKEKKTNENTNTVLTEENTLLKNKISSLEEEIIINVDKIREFEAKIANFDEVSDRYEFEKKTNEKTIEMFQKKSFLTLEEYDSILTLRQSLPLNLFTTYIRFCKLNLRNREIIELKSDSILAKSVFSKNILENVLKTVDIEIQINRIEEIFCCFERFKPFIVIRLDSIGQNCINESLKTIITDNSMDPLNDTNQWITIVSNNKDKQLIKRYINYCKYISPKIKTISLNTKETTDLIERLDLKQVILDLESLVKFRKQLSEQIIEEESCA